MGVPKFFRYISERYPCLSEFVKEHQIPEFDNLYLDMNGIIHNCSHPDDGNAHFRITEEKIFTDIFHYIEALFRMIKPLKIFFMAVDGVAPRAKMNQQRGRRFRSAKDAQKLEDEAIKRGETLPSESRFDSNCITPGTDFMARLHEQLKYFVVKKISEDPLWQRCKIIYSGHETPGEGEHKIMDYIRYMRSQPNYDPNTRHCLYGLDADLIMLGLCTHDPHFSLLREEVKFGRKATKKTSAPEEIRFALLHLSLMREYLELEFDSLKRTLKTFQFDIEKVVDDWVLMGFLVGNDFIPNLPNLHIADGALPVLYKAYMEILPDLDGYINEGGILNLERFEIFMKKLGEIDVQNFEEVRDDMFYFEQKTGRKMQPFAKNNTKLKYMEFWKPEGDEENVNPDLLEPLEDENVPKDSDLSDLIARTEAEYDDEDEEEEEENITSDDDVEFEKYKRSYYMNKLEYEKVTPEVMKSQAEGYVRAIQWNLHYYYNGVCSWSWYYPHHYAPYISDIKNFRNLKLEYDLGKPFMPYEQLLAVLPAASKELLPSCYQDLMTSESSPIIRYYPEKFDTDLNGKKQEWEAVVLVPFIDENVLLEAMRSCYHRLSPSEAERNRHGPMLCYSYTEENLGKYDSSMYFPDISNNHAQLQAITIDEIKVPREKLVKGAYPGVLMDVYYPGFPTFKYLDYQGRLENAKVNVFGQPSRGENMIIRIVPSERVLDGELPLNLLNKTVFVGYPHLTEAKVVSICNSQKKYTYAGEGQEPKEEVMSSIFKKGGIAVTESYRNRFGIEFGKILVLLTVQKMIGQRYIFTSNGRISLEKIFCKDETLCPLQLIVEDINVYSKPEETNFITLDKVFPVGSICFTLTKNEFYGCKAIVEQDSETPEGQVCLSVNVYSEPDLRAAQYFSKNTECRYRSLYFAASQSCLSHNIFSRITGSLYASARNREGGLKSINLGLDLKLSKKNLETPGYTKRIDGVWYYTDDAIQAVMDYADAFPEVFDYMAKIKNMKNDSTSAEDIFPEDCEDRVKAALTWLKGQPFYKQEKIVSNSPSLDKDVIEQIEKIVNAVSTTNPKKTTLYCSAELLYKEELSYGNLLPDSSVKTELFDRIINIRNNHIVPLGLKGTVIGICRSSTDSSEYMYNILFDREFEGGLELNCSKGRGYRLPLNAFINISHGIRLYQPNLKKAGGHKDQPNRASRDENFKKNKPHNKNISNENTQNSAFAKFNSSPQSGKDYHAVPPYMPNGESIYKRYGFHNQENYCNLQQSKPSYNCSSPEQRTYSGGPAKMNKQKNQDKRRTDISEQPSYQIYKKENNQAIGLPGPKIARRNKTESVASRLDSKQKSDFMPIFDKTPMENPVEETTDALKKLLKIGSEDDNEKMSSTNNSPSKSNPNFQHNESNLPNAPLIPSIQLLSYYQSKGLGLPRYQYYSSKAGIQAVIKLPNRQNIIGPYSDTKVGASELVAEKALQVLCSNDNQAEHNPMVPQSFPAPPKQWWSPEKSHEKHSHTQKSSPPKASTNKNWKDFIPLQVVKKEKANSSGNSNQKIKISKGDNGSIRTALNEKPENSSNEVITTNNCKEQKPRKQRKMRIAANFGHQS